MFSRIDISFLCIWRMHSGRRCVSGYCSADVLFTNDAWELSEAQLSSRQETQPFVKQIAVKECKQRPTTADTSQQFCWCATRPQSSAAVGATVSVASEPLIYSEFWREDAAILRVPEASCWGWAVGADFPHCRRCALIGKLHYQLKELREQVDILVDCCISDSRLLCILLDLELTSFHLCCSSAPGHVEGET